MRIRYIISAVILSIIMCYSYYKYYQARNKMFGKFRGFVYEKHKIERQANIRQFKRNVKRRGKKLLKVLFKYIFMLYIFLMLLLLVSCYPIRKSSNKAITPKLDLTSNLIEPKLNKTQWVSVNDESLACMSRSDSLKNTNNLIELRKKYNEVLERLKICQDYHNKVTAIN